MNTIMVKEIIIIFHGSTLGEHNYSNSSLRVTWVGKMEPWRRSLVNISMFIKGFFILNKLVSLFWVIDEKKPKFY